jgi:hypothetical protein
MVCKLLPGSQRDSENIRYGNASSPLVSWQGRGRSDRGIAKGSIPKDTQAPLLTTSERNFNGAKNFQFQ